MEHLMRKFGNLNSEEEDWQKLIKTIGAMLELRELVHFPEAPPLIRLFVTDQGWKDLVELYSLLTETLESDCLAVRQGLDPNLDRLKRTANEMPHLLSLLAREQGWEEGLGIIYIRQVGYLVRLSSGYEFPYDLDTQGWELQFRNDTGSYFMTPLTQQLD